jgi:hypothetical protein
VSINLIYPGRDTANLVKDLSDNWLTSGPIRACIFLSNAWHKLEPQALTRSKYTVGKGSLHYQLNGVNIFGPNELAHSWSIWAATSAANYSWLVFYAQDMCSEYLRRFPHLSKHGISRMLEALENMPESIEDFDWTEPWFAKEVEFES